MIDINDFSLNAKAKLLHLLWVNAKTTSYYSRYPKHHTFSYNIAKKAIMAGYINLFMGRFICIDFTQDDIDEFDFERINNCYGMVQKIISIYFMNDLVSLQ